MHQKKINKREKKERQEKTENNNAKKQKTSRTTKIITARPIEYVECMYGTFYMCVTVYVDMCI
jgi:hypothetical protein